MRQDMTDSIYITRNNNYSYINNTGEIYESHLVLSTGNQLPETEEKIEIINTKKEKKVTEIVSQTKKIIESEPEKIQEIAKNNDTLSESIVPVESLYNKQSNGITWECKSCKKIYISAKIISHAENDHKIKTIEGEEIKANQKPKSTPKKKK